LRLPSPVSGIRFDRLPNGVGEKVEKAMQSLNVRLADVGVPVGAVGMNHAFIPLIAFTSPSHGGGFGGGGGGGFGGGGAGGR